MPIRIPNLPKEDPTFRERVLTRATRVNGLAGRVLRAIARGGFPQSPLDLGLVLTEEAFAAAIADAVGGKRDRAHSLRIEGGNGAEAALFLDHIWKFRTLFAEVCDASARKIVTKGDPRVSRVGRFRRRTSIDELPQIVNVMRREMSLVGPRPHAVDAVTSTLRLFEDIVPGYARRHLVEPGITGLAQSRGWRGEIRMPWQLRGRVACDLRYIEKWSPFLDLWILLRTTPVLAGARGAY